MIFAIVNETEKTIFSYKIRGYTVSAQPGTFININAPVPANKKQKEKLFNILSPYFGKILLPNSIKNLKDFENAGYNTYHFENTVLIYAFLDYCKHTHPTSVLISGSDYLSLNFFKRLSHYTNRIVLPNCEYNSSLCRSILKISGAPLFFNNEIKNTSVALMLKKQLQCIPSGNCIVFDRKIFRKIENIKCGFIMPELKDFNSLETSAALFFEWGDKKVCDFWKTLVIKESMIYNII